MAKGRFISKEICLDKKVNELSDGYSMVGFTWLITHADCEGRIYGDPAIVKSLLFPRRPDITIEMVAGYIQEWADKKLVTLYVANGDIYIEFPNFGKHQVGLRKDRESKSSIPSSEDGELYTFPDSSGINPDSSGKNRVKLSKVNIKLSEVNIGADKSANPEPTYEDCAEDGESIPKKPKSKYAADPRTKHVAIQAWKQATNRYPPKEIYDTVIQTLGDSPDIEKLKNVFAQWVGRGYNRTNITGVLDWYVNGIANNARSKNTGMDAVKAELARLEQENGG